MKAWQTVYSQTLEEIEGLTGKRYDTIHIVGGGSNAEYLNKLTAEKSGRRVLAGPGEATAIGNLMAQMIKNGEFKGLWEARACVKQSFEIQEFQKGEEASFRELKIDEKRSMTDEGEEECEQTRERYESARELYKSIGVDTDAAIEKTKAFRFPFTAGREMM